MRYKVAAYVLASVVNAVCGHSFAQDGEKSAEEIAALAKETAVYIKASYIDPNTQDVKPGEVGTGFLVSADGLVLTAYHVIKDWELQSKEQQEDHPLVATIGSKFSAQVNIEFIDKDPSTDLALLRIRGQPVLAAVEVCFVSGGLEPGAPIYGYGYPNDTEFTPSAGSFSSANGDGGVWLGSVNFAHGMSGGPVYNKYGEVIGIIRGKIDFQDATNFITPIRRAKRIVDPVASLNENCAGAAPPVVAPDEPLPLLPPNPLEGTKVVYFEKTADGGKVRQVLDENNIATDIRISETSGTTNWIYCTQDVPIDHLKKLASSLVEAGVGIVGISPSVHPELSHRLSIEKISLDAPRLSLSSSQIESIEACNPIEGAVNFEQVGAQWDDRSIWKSSDSFCDELISFWNSAENLSGLHYRESGDLVTPENFTSGRLDETFAIDNAPSPSPRCFSDTNVVYCRKTIATSTDVFSRIYRRTLDEMRSCMEAAGGSLTNTGQCRVGDAPGLACSYGFRRSDNLYPVWLYARRDNGVYSIGIQANARELQAP
ncbi:S1C family serine protease [Rhizobium leguminosarum]|uniref:S1C family serine protease n=1 Tax=Rhizobium leguminosarum TaxID=384 RepID=UPI00103266E8|nr:serine protease [Rhizobium leguminosarum]TBG15990.1 serine protease [Rhizobium leguminosarum]